MKTLKDLFMHQLRDVYYAEKQILKALPEMASKADSDQLRKAFEDHLEETKGQKDRLEEVFKLLDAKPEGETCPAIDGIIKEHKEIASEIEDADALDAAMIANAQAVEHYEISRYGTLIAWADQLGLPAEVASLLKQTLDQEYNADSSLSQLAETKLNQQAA
ncbi:YciE/YciF ferroxidase family protein [Methyloligella solikamskensis]|uniref:Ferritin-like domain-containing protein n=1 Tax=Methyloligella solikamskensis TaxID=1177756 RepID=A0ABW3J9A3_9HYPH